MFSEQHQADLFAAFQRVADALLELARAVAEAFRKLFDLLHQTSWQITEHILSKFPQEPEPKHIPPRLAPKLGESSAYYSAHSFHQPKRAYRQEKIWRHQG